jgi:SAM-dependent methyltransferase
MGNAGESTRDPRYAKRLERLGTAWWKRLLDVQRPYRWNLRRLELGYVLDVGCGLGRNLENLGGPDAGVGVDHSAEAVAVARRRGFVAYLPDEFAASPHAVPDRFDALLFSHVLEHMYSAEARELVTTYLPYLRSSGRVVMITPQEAGFRSDPTHVTFLDLDELTGLANALGLRKVRSYSFPFPRRVGNIFKYNEFVLVSSPGAVSAVRGASTP